MNRSYALSFLSKSICVRLAIGISFLLLALWPAMSMRESLWIDELHSAWVISGGWDDVIPRAALGNQSPLYFGMLKVWSIVFEPFLAPDSYGEGILRTSSLLGWVFLCCASLGALFRTVPKRALSATITIIIIWLWLDRIGAFYAIELRPYIWVALMSLLMMLAGANLANVPNRFGITWLIASILAFYLHYTAIIIVVLSWCAMIVVIAVRWTRTDSTMRSPIIRNRAIELTILALFLLPGLYRLVGISNKSQQWSSFAGNASLFQVVDLLPWVFWTLVPLAVLMVERIYQFKKSDRELPASSQPRNDTSPLPESLAVRGPSFQETLPLTPRPPLPEDGERGSKSAYHFGLASNTLASSQPRGEGSNHSRALTFDRVTLDPQFAWLLQLCMVGFGSLLFTWLLTVTETAPLLHRRYLMGAYPAFLLLGAFMLGRIHDQRVLLATGLLSATLMIGWQGTANEWRAGRWIAWQRQEDWRGAIDFLNLNRRSDEPVFLVSNLIEARGSNIDVTIDRNYLRYPLTSLYAINDAQLVYLLPNERLNWTSGIFPQVARSPNDIGWIIARSQKVSELEADLNASSVEKRAWRVAPVYFGGGVQVWKLECR